MVGVPETETTSSHTHELAGIVASLNPELFDCPAVLVSVISELKTSNCVPVRVEAWPILKTTFVDPVMWERTSVTVIATGVKNIVASSATTGS